MIVAIAHPLDDGSLLRLNAHIKDDLAAHQNQSLSSQLHSHKNK